MQIVPNYQNKDIFELLILEIHNILVIIILLIHLSNN